MAQVSSSSSLDSRGFDLSFFRAYDYAAFADNSYEGFEAGDLPGMTQTWTPSDAAGFWTGSSNPNFATDATAVGGDGFQVNAQNMATAGTLTGFLRGYTGPSTEQFLFIVNTSVSAVSFQQAALSQDTADDREILRIMLQGNDLVTGTRFNDYFAAASGDDTLLGDAGNDTLSGDAGTDRLTGGIGNDSLLGGKGADVLTGDAGRDTLAGGSGADKLTGGADSDLLLGGVDRLRDVFIYTDISESGRGAARDIIVNFTTGIDDMDLRAIDANTALHGNQTFVFSRSTAQANAVWMVDSGTGLLLRGDVDGNLVADFEIRLNDITALRAVDILL